MTTPLAVLKEYWKYDSFRNQQEAIINSVLNNKNTLVLLPTGSGKSLCYQIPALMKDGVCIVISPLIALMDDQIKNLKKRGLKAAALKTSMSQGAIVQLFDNILYGGVKFLYLSPERLQSGFIQEKIKQLKVCLIAVDEAHCISEWGHDFRPSYRKVNILREIHSTTPIIALTASATSKVFEDIKENLQINDAIHYKASLKRPELTYKVLKTENINRSVYEILTNNDNPSIIYTTSRKSTKNMSLYLNSKKIKSTFYHGGLTLEEKKVAYENWLTEKTPVMVATNAFGMGIDKNNVTTIIHTDLPFSIENYMQESGRAGRNGKKATAHLLFNTSTIHEFKKRYEKSIVPLNEIKDIYKKLNQHYQIVKGELPLETFRFDLTSFCKKYLLNLNIVYDTIDLLEKEEVIELSESIQNKSLIKFNIKHHLLLNYTDEQPHFKKLIKVLLRTYAGLFDHLSKIDENLLASKLEMTVKDISDQLNALSTLEIIDYKPKYFGNTLKFLVPREDNYAINSISKNIKKRYRIKQEKVDAVLNYLHTKQCRNIFLLNYFGENASSCGNCDICKKQISKNGSLEQTAQQILALLSTASLTPKDIIHQTEYDKELVLTTLQILLDKDKIKLTSQNKFQVV